MTRALLEEVAFRFRSLGEVKSKIGIDLRDMRTSGGITKSPFWLEIMASSLNRPLTMPI